MLPVGNASCTPVCGRAIRVEATPFLNDSSAARGYVARSAALQQARVIVTATVCAVGRVRARGGACGTLVQKAVGSAARVAAPAAARARAAPGIMRVWRRASPRCRDAGVRQRMRTEMCAMRTYIELSPILPRYHTSCRAIC